MIRSSVKPVVVSSANGNQFKNGGTKTGVEMAFGMIAEGKDVLDALIAGVNLCELDPEETSVGYGGLPNADGVVQLDASCMHGPTQAGRRRRVHRGRAHAVAGGQGGARADRPSSDRRQGRPALRAQHRLHDRGRPQHRDARAARGSNGSGAPTRQHYLDPDKRAEAGDGGARARDDVRGWIDPRTTATAPSTATASTPKGEICGVTTTSGLAWKIPGRVGDSPILGAGLYVDGEVGAAGSTGRGEANLFSLSSFLIVEQMRRGKSPKDAGMEALPPDQGEHRREATAERARRSRTSTSTSTSSTRRASIAGVTMFPGPRGQRFAVCDEKGPRLETCEPLLQGTPE